MWQNTVLWYSCEASVSIYQNTWHHIPEDQNLDTHCHDIIKSHRNKYKQKLLLTPVNEYAFSPQVKFLSLCADNNPATPRPMAHINSVITKLNKDSPLL